MNKPYVKQYDDTGNLLNPINGFYPGKLFLGFAKDNNGNPNENKPMFFPNRKERRFKSKLGNNRKVTKGRLQFKQIIPANTVIKIVPDQNGILFNQEINYPQRIIIQTKNLN
jgi:hypothetical protein